jgi:hypothetical protein
MNDIRCYKLITGEEIIGKCIVETDKEVRLDKVRTLQFVPGPQGTMGLAMVPWMASAIDETVDIKRLSMIGSPNGSVPKQLEDRYLQETSGLEIATSI